jgi:FkbM family methyltransferase
MSCSDTLARKSKGTRCKQQRNDVLPFVMRKELRKWIHAAVWYKRHKFGQLAVPEHGYLKRLIKPGDVCCDVGAHAGSWTVPMSQWVGSAGHVYAFEAFPYYANVLTKLMVLRRRRNVTVISCALGAQRCDVRVIWRDRTGKSLTGLTHVASQGEAEQNQNDAVDVKGVPLDCYFAEGAPTVRFLKCDVEGCEFGVFCGAQKLITRDRPLIFTELDNEFLKRYGHSVADVSAFFRARNYVAYAFASASEIHRVDWASMLGNHDLLFAPEEWRKL